MENDSLLEKSSTFYELMSYRVRGLIRVSLWVVIIELYAVWGCLLWGLTGMSHPPNHQSAMLLATILSMHFLFFASEIQIIFNNARRPILFKNPRLRIILLNFVFLELMMADRPPRITLYLMFFLLALFIVDQHQRFVYSSCKIDYSSINKDRL